jgi:hypothetical protein
MKTDKVLWAAMVFSTVIYAVMAYVALGKDGGSFEERVRQPYALALYGMALASFVAGFVVPRSIRAPRTRMIVGLALFEACAVFGLIAAFLARDWRLFLPAWIVGLIGMVRAYPSDDSAENQHLPR